MTGRSSDLVHDTIDQSVIQSIMNTVQTCYECLWDPAQSRETRRLLLQSYQTATQLLRSALLLDCNGTSLAVPIHALALYEVRPWIPCLIRVLD